MNHGSLFSGIGGFDLAAEWMGWENKFHCEWNEFGQRVLKYYWPNAKSYGDITKTDFTIWNGRIDILTGGFPCQPYSQAGKRLGKDDERHLWPEMLRAIAEIKPRWIVGENVYGLISWNGGLVFEEVQAQLEDEGYQVQPYILPACAVGAPHRRDRVWFVAYAGHNARRCPKRCKSERERELLQGKQQGRSIRCQGSRCNCIRPTSNADHTRTHEFLRIDGYRPPKNERRKGEPQPEFRAVGRHGITTNTSKAKLQRREFSGSIGEARTTEKEGGQFSRSICSAWEKFPTQSPICNGDDGLSARLDGITFSSWRNESIKAGGNAIVPQVALQIFRAIEAFEAREH